MNKNRYRGITVNSEESRQEWVFGYLIGKDAIVGEICDWEDEYFCTEFWRKVDPMSVGQYTGLKDKNGTMVYEGDVLSHPEGPNAEIKYVPEHAAYLASYIGELGATLNYLDSGVIEKCEVIGNAFENPELLSAGDN